MINGSVSRLSRATAAMYAVWLSVQMEGLFYLDRATRLWNCGLFLSGECLKTFQGHIQLGMRSVAFSPDGRTVISGSEWQDFETVVCFLVDSVSRLSMATETM